jgi:tetratricopeptide (TPR) repeat protein
MMGNFGILCGALLSLSGCMSGNSPPAASTGDPAHGTPETRFFLENARAFAAQQDYTRAEQYLNLAAQSGSPDFEVTPLLVDVCVQDQRYRAALQYVQDYLRRHPRAYRLRFVQASLLSAIGEVARAREELEKVLSANPRHADAHYSLAVLLRDELGSHLEADEHFRSYLELRPRGAHAEEAGQSLLETMP